MLLVSTPNSSHSFIENEMLTPGKDDSWGFQRFFDSIGEMVIRLRSKVNNCDQHTKKVEDKKDNLLDDSSSYDVDNSILMAETLKRRRREKSVDGLGDGDLDSLLSYHSLAQDNIAENLLQLAKTMKQQTLLASNIIKEDTKNLEKSKQMTDNNISELSENCTKLQKETQSNWQLWVWVLLFVVFAVFISMVLLMKVTKKQ